MLIKVKTLVGKEIEIDIDQTDKIERIKERIEEKEGIPPPQQRLIFSGKQMNDDKTVSEYKIQDKAAPKISWIFANYLGDASNLERYLFTLVYK